MEIVSTVETALFILLGVFLSAQMWWGVSEYLAKPRFEIVSSTVEGPVVRGRTAQFTDHIIKRKDCPGEFTVRIKDSAGISTVLQEGRLGANPPSEYTYRKLVLIPTSVATGPVTISLVVSMTCDGSFGTVARASMQVVVE